MGGIQIGRLLSANTRQFNVGCNVSQIEIPALGALSKVELNQHTSVYGIIYDIYIADDGFVRQLVTAPEMDASVISDHRLNRSVPLEIQVLTVGYRENGKIFHLLPPRPPLGLDLLTLCPDDELIEFTSVGRFGYLRHLLREKDDVVGEVLAAHLQQASRAYRSAGKNLDWVQSAIQEIIILLRDDYETLMKVLHALSDSLLFEEASYQEKI